MLPSLFVSHGAPTLMIETGPAVDFLRGLGRDIERRHGRPKAILCVSAHWETEKPLAATSAAPETIHDFYGFPEALYRLTYPAPGAPATAEKAVALLRAAGIDSGADSGQGLDHGAWAPLLLMWPDHDIPVAQVSVQSHRDAAHHLAVGRALAPLRAEGVLILGSGGAVHNLRYLIQRRGTPEGAVTPAWAAEFTGWLAERFDARDLPALVDWRHKAPHAAMAQPSDEHFLPLFVALGAAGRDFQAERLFAGFDHGSLGMDAYAFQ